MNKVSFVTGGHEGMASFRYRVLAPTQFLGQHLIKCTVSSQADPEANAVVFSKHWTYNDWTYARFCKERGQTVVFDICDDHFDDNLNEHYYRMCDVADRLICNSEVMRQRIFSVTGMKAIVIEDPVISRQQLYSQDKPASALWYGQSMNLPGLYEVYTGNYNLEVAVPPNAKLDPVLDNTRVSLVAWHPAIVGEAAGRNSVAVLPYRQGKEAKSANRVLEALWCGLPVVTDPIPAVVDLGKNGILYFGEDVSNDSLMDFIESTDFTTEMQEAQKMIQEKYSPEVIAGKWAAALRGVV
jgi:hypothetical protein